jgi:hypothetical protein
MLISNTLIGVPTWVPWSMWSLVRTRVCHWYSCAVVPVCMRAIRSHMQRPSVRIWIQLYTPSCDGIKSSVLVVRLHMHAVRTDAQPIAWSAMFLPSCHLRNYGIPFPLQVHATQANRLIWVLPRFPLTFMSVGNPDNDHLSAPCVLVLCVYQICHLPRLS